MILEHGEHVLVSGDDPEAELLGIEDGLLLTRRCQDVEGILPLLGKRWIEGCGQSASMICRHASVRGSITSK